MVTQSSGIRGLGSLSRAKLAAAFGAMTGWGSRQRKRAALVEQHRLHFELLCKAMDDPALAAVLDTYDTDVPPDRQRQYLFANALYINALYYHRIGALSLNELYGHLRMICRNDIFREYWAATRHHRESLPASSEEARLGTLTDDLVRDMDALVREQEDGEQWWVVGELPEE
ncbi:DUF6082 family protein [Streptomyces sp. Ru72]|uniref:DUF6082 family protein n=1 Tax=Streptomyces sp. Ru72 TaxID=2080747 RepID=UPI000CDD42F9|nr:DUF6082 family protein [Streptomyces sp. Ru72]POX48495.1 hypothetical protein C3488_20460 [Streptomyces sp. Ru72]